MEIPVLTRIEAEILRLQNPSSISRFLKAQTLLTWGAIIIAVIATFSSLLTRINRLIIFRFHKAKSVISQPLVQSFYDSSSDDDNEDEDDKESEDDNDEDISSDEEQEEETRFNEDFSVAGTQRQLNRNFSWSEFVTGRSVVKTWDELGQGFGKASQSLISLWDLNKYEISKSFGKNVSTMPSPAVMVSTGSRNVALRVFDSRISRQFPQIFAEWQPSCRKILGGDDNDDVNVSSVIVRDMRKITSPVENVTEADVGTLCFSDGNCDLCNCGSVVSRCRNAVISYLF